MVMPGTGLYLLWKEGKYQPLTTAEAAEIIGESFRFTPPWVRVMRVQRDIPTMQTSAGVDRTNLRQYVDEYCRRHRIISHDIRAREVRIPRGGVMQWDEDVLSYEASGGKEFFIQALAHGRLLGFCRLRLPCKSLRSEITPQSALIRELHVYGRAAALGEEGEVQHRGIGTSLLKKAEDIARSQGKEKMVVISGIGAREYYYKRGYHREGPYTVKVL
jgi:elongator complex protein 3